MNEISTDPRMDRFVPADPDDATTFVEVACGLASQLDAEPFHERGGWEDPVDILALVLNHGEQFHALLDLAVLGPQAPTPRLPSESVSERPVGTLRLSHGPRPHKPVQDVREGGPWRLKEV